MENDKHIAIMRARAKQVPAKKTLFPNNMLSRDVTFQEGFGGEHTVYDRTSSAMPDSGALMRARRMKYY